MPTMAADPATAVIAESGSALPEKLPSIGVENAAAAIFGLKQDIAAQTNKNYQVIAGTIPTGSRTVQGVGGAFSKDLTAWFTGGFAQAAPVGLVNFKDLEPTDGTDPNDPNNPNILRRKVYTDCDYKIFPCGGSHCSTPSNFCNDPQYPHPEMSRGTHYERSPSVSNCSGPVITVLGFGGALTNGFTESFSSGGDDCPFGDEQCQNVFRSGSVTMNNLTIARGDCVREQWYSGVKQTTSFNWQAVSVCCRWRWDPDFPPSPTP